MQTQQKEIDLSKVALVLKNNKKRILQVTGITTGLAIVYCIFATPIFTATVIINPPKLTDAGSGASNALNGLSALAGGGGGILSQKTDTDVTIAVLKTRAIQDIIIHKFNLQKKMDKKNIELTRIALSSKVTFIPDLKSSFVEIDVDNEDPTLAADIANYYAVALGQVFSNIAYGKTNNRYQFFNAQIFQAESSLNVAQIALEKFIESNGFIASKQAEVAADLSAQLQAQLIIAQAQLKSMSLYATPNNPDYIELESQINGYKVQLDRMNVAGTPDPIGINAESAPRLANQYANLMRELTLRQEVYKIIVQQYEANRLDLLSEQAPVGIQVVDHAVIPLYKSKPKRANIIVGGFMLGLIASSVYFIVRNRKKIIVEVDNEKSAN